ncbi:hypothetical protein [Rhodopirellula europaea]|uniref:hypothetical protein n=1 Tax=Rhodopirellula europaea TaxID=1263866 RepID=UPI0003470CED|nr:hypothetical protein [Rhodopirellula europaea]
MALRERYAALQCAKCKKIDESIAIQRGIDEDVRIVARQDYVLCGDGLIAVSQRLRDLLAENNINGVRFAPIPASSNYFILVPALTAPTDVETCGMEFRRRCSVCGRFRETLFFPLAASMEFPSDQRLLLASSIRFEFALGETFCFMASDYVVDILKASKITGLEYQVVD